LFNLEIENDEEPLSKSHLKKIAKLFKVAEKDLVVVWLADKILNTIHDEENKQQALQLTLNILTKS
jgi:hypothetical protein